MADKLKSSKYLSGMTTAEGATGGGA